MCLGFLQALIPYSSLWFELIQGADLGFPGGTSGKEPACQCQRHGFDPWVRKIPWRRKWQLNPVFLPGESNGQKSLPGCSLWDHKGSDRSERLSTHTYKKQTIYFIAPLKFPSPPAVTWKCLQRGAAAALLKANNNKDDDAVKDTYWMGEGFRKWQICKGNNIQNRHRIYKTQRKKTNKQTKKPLI